MLTVAAASVAAAMCAAALVVAALIDPSDTRLALALALPAVVCVAAAAAGLFGPRVRLPRHPAMKSVFAAACGAWGTMVAISTVVYVAAGATGSVPDALLESVAGFCTTNLSVFGDPAALPAGVLFWRAATQWIGGFATLALVVAALPLHTDSLAMPGLGAPVGSPAPSPRFATQLRRLVTVYATCSVLCAAAYAAAGMGAFDAVTYAFTTVSTGGFGNHPGGLAHFDSAATEWVAVVFMALAGAGVMALWWAACGRLRLLRRSLELRVYLAVLAVAVVLLAVWTWDGAGADAVRQSAFSVTAALSSTGFEVAEWSGWIWGAQFLLLVLISVGGMDGTAGGGLRLRRAIAAVRYAYRELVVEIHPRTVHVVKIGRRSVSEPSLALLQGHQVLFTAGVAGGAFALSLAGDDLLAAVSGAISALATMGPAPGVPAAPVQGADRATLAVLMLLGRLSFYPLLGAVVGLAGAARRAARVGERSNGGQWRRP